MSNHQDAASWLIPLALVTLTPWPISLVLGILLRRWLRPRGAAGRVGYFFWWVLLTLASFWW
jgi:hypothetical protein